MNQHRWAIVAIIAFLALAGFYALRYFYWLNQPGLPVYP